MTADVYRDGSALPPGFQKGRERGRPEKGARSPPAAPARVIRWKPDTDVFTDIDVPADDLPDTLKRQAVVNAGVTLVL